MKKKKQLTIVIHETMEHGLPTYFYWELKDGLASLARQAHWSRTYETCRRYAKKMALLLGIDQIYLVRISDEIKREYKKKPW